MRQIVFKNQSITTRLEESFKSLRTNIQFCGADKQVILLTSCVAGEGKSSTSLRLGISLAELGKRVVLVDADLRKSVMLGRIVRDGEEILGLTHYLTRQAALQEVLCSTNIPNFHVITSGPYSPNPAELLSSPAFAAMIKALRTAYDYIIVDTAPLGTVIDAAIVAKCCDGAVLVIEAGKINYRFVQDTKAQMEKSGCPILGAILNKVDIKKPGYGRYGKYGKYYGGYYGDYYGDYSSPSTSSRSDGSMHHHHSSSGSKTASGNGSAHAATRPASQTARPAAQAAKPAQTAKPAQGKSAGGAES